MGGKYGKGYQGEDHGKEYDRDEGDTVGDPGQDHCGEGDLGTDIVLEIIEETVTDNKVVVVVEIVTKEEAIMVETVEEIMAEIMKGGGENSSGDHCGGGPFLHAAFLRTTFLRVLRGRRPALFQMYRK